MKHFSANEFHWIKTTLRLAAQARRGRNQNPCYAAPIPEEIGLQLTYRCNLRCRHCFQWNSTGHFQNNPPGKGDGDLKVSLIEKVLHATRPAKSRLYIWGGEPLVHRHWDDIAVLLANDPRRCVICTNGLLIEKRITPLLHFSEKLSFLISLDGVQAEHDEMRGQGTFTKVIHQIELLLELRQQGEFRGRVTAICVVNQHNATKLYDVVTYCSDIGLDGVIFNFPWTISSETAGCMDTYYAAHFSWLPGFQKGTDPSWYSHTYQLPEKLLPELIDQIDRISNHPWELHVDFQPRVDNAALKTFITGGSVPAQNRSRCLSVSNRMEIYADGWCGACKFFPEMRIGNLNTDDLLDIWHHSNFNRLREIVDRELMPVCAKCSLLYLAGI
jgi:MoaA/NifB/PqqE/SkfB family radical SAM enzyme